MFVCDKCLNITKPAEKENKVVTLVRPKNYYEKVKSVDENGNEILVNGRLVGTGTETVKEIRLCALCF